MITYKIVLIENQKAQFDIISNLFRNEPGSDINYEIFPKEKEFTLFIDSIKVYLNQYYKPEHNKSALLKIINMINNFKLNTQDNTEPNAFIIDHKLVGCHKSLSGIDLAIELRSNPGYKDQPMIFLSRTSRSDPKVMEGLPNLTGEHEWIPKGYAGKEILDEEYFKKKVLDIIPDLIKESMQKSVVNLMIALREKISLIFSMHNKRNLEKSREILDKYDHTKGENINYCLDKREKLINILKYAESNDLTIFEVAENFIKEIRSI
jgi:hypothetical protein